MRPILLLLLSFSALAGVAEPNVIWDHSDIRVCWGDELDVEVLKKNHDEGLSAESLLKPSVDLKNKLKRKVTSEYVASRTGIHFSGWRSCRDTPQADAVIFITSDAGSSSSLGQNGINNFNGYSEAQRDTRASLLLQWNRLSRAKDKLSPEESFLFTGLHEFGHLAGLRHEHVRPEHKKDPFCAGLPETFEAFESTTRAYTRYDQSSIMSYCLNDELNKHGLQKRQIALSAGDVEALGCLYKKDCHSQAIQP